MTLPEAVPARPAELERQRRLVDQMVTMHAVLRDRARRISIAISIVLLSGSIVSAALAFAGDDTRLELVGIGLTRSTWLGVFSVLVFVGTLVELVTDYRGVARQHSSAVRMLSNLKAQYQRAAPDAHSDWTAAATALSARYVDVMAQLVPIPESRFNNLKARHLRKVEISKLLSATPGLSERQARRRLDQRLQAPAAEQSPTTPSAG